MPLWLRLSLCSGTWTCYWDQLFSSFLTIGSIILSASMLGGYSYGVHLAMPSMSFALTYWMPAIHKLDTQLRSACLAPRSLGFPSFLSIVRPLRHHDAIVALA